MAQNSEEQSLATQRALNNASTLMLRMAKETVRRHPLKVGGYLLGLLLCLFFNGAKVSDSNRAAYEHALGKIDRTRIFRMEYELDQVGRQYYSSKGWFSCSAECQIYRVALSGLKKEYNLLKAEEASLISEAKSNLGLLSEFGVAETRNLFWERFAQGKGFAYRQSKWDALFMGISAMSRDETLVSYAMRVIVNALFNFTLGVCGAVVAFLFGLYALISTYRVGILYGLMFFIFAAIAAISFALTWLLILYFGTAGTVFVAAKLAAANMRIEGGGSASNPYRQRVRPNY